MIVDLVVWRPKDNMPLNELQEATNWVIQARLDDGDMVPLVHFTELTIYNDRPRKISHFQYAWHSTSWYVVVVTDEPIDEEKARELYDTYIAQIKQEADEEKAKRDLDSMVVPELVDSNSVLPSGTSVVHIDHSSPNGRSDYDVGMQSTSSLHDHDSTPSEG